MYYYYYYWVDLVLCVNKIFSLFKGFIKSQKRVIKLFVPPKSYLINSPEPLQAASSYI